MRSKRRFAVTCAALGAAAIAAPALSAPGATAPEGARAIPLRAPVPSWYTPALHAEVMAAGPAGVPLPAGANIPASSLAFPGIRPGQLIIVANKFLCSSNFVFKDSSATLPSLLGGSFTTASTTPSKTSSKTPSRTGPKPTGSGSGFFIGTAGHCGKAGDPVVMLFAPVGLVRIGKISKSTDGGVGNDFALIAIDPALNKWVSPSLAYWGGPTGVYTGTGPAAVQHAGWGLVVGTGGTPRAGLGLVWTADQWRFESAIAPGDSGSGAIVAGGLGAGNITHIVVNTRHSPPAYMAGTAMTKIMRMVGSLQLATCAAVPWPAPGCPPV